MLNAFRRIKALVSQGTGSSEGDTRIRLTDEEINIISDKLAYQKLRKFVGHTESDDLNNMEKNEMAKPSIGSVVTADEGVVEGEGEDSQTKALRLFRFKILHMACNMDPTPESYLDRTDPRYDPSPDYDTVRTCRLVSKDWNEEISSIFISAGKSVLVVNPLLHMQKKKRQVSNHEPEGLLEALKGPLVRPESLRSQNSDLPFPPFKLTLPSGFFYKEIENSFVHSAWCHFERYLHELYFSLPADSTMVFYWPQLNLCNVKKIKFKCTNETHNSNRLGGLGSLHHNPFVHGNYMYLLQQILNSAINAEIFILQCYAPHFAPGLFRMSLPKGLKFMDLPLVKMSSDEAVDCIKYCGNPGQPTVLKTLLLRAPLRTFKRDDGVTACHGSYLLQRYCNSLEQIELNVSGQEWDHIIWRMRSDYVYEPLKLDISVTMKKLTSLELHAGIWEITGMKSYQKQLPMLKNLKLTLITREAQIKELYESQSETVERLTLSFINDMSYEVLKGFAESLPNLRELDVIVRDSEPGLHICFQKFHMLKKLHVIYNGCNSDEAKEALCSAITGIPKDKYKELANDETTILDAMKTYEDNSSLRNLSDLEELKLNVKSNSSIDTSILFRTTFLRMSKLKRLIMSEKTLLIEDDQKDFIRKENRNGMAIEWI